jgi:hypothetical protein
MPARRWASSKRRRSASLRKRRCCWSPATFRIPSRCTRCGRFRTCQPARWRLTLAPAAAGGATRCDFAALDALRAAIPAARVLPLLQALAHDAEATIQLEGEYGFALTLHTMSSHGPTHHA